MSRLIVKNLPNGMKEDRFRKLFAAFGTLTDCCLKFTKDGKFRKFGFVGFKSEDEAKTALNHFNRSFIDTSRITVEVCKSFGDPSKPKPWSKHSQKPANKPTANPDHTGTKKDKKVKNVAGNLKELEGNEEFREFLTVHQKRSQVATWANDTLAEKPKAGKLKPVDDYLNFDSDESSDLSEESGDEFQEEEDKGNKTKGNPTEKVAVTKGLSDMDYLKSKVVKDTSLDEEREEEEEDSEQHEKSSEEEEKPSNVEAIDIQMKKGAMLEEIKGQGKPKEEEKKKGTKLELKNRADSTEATMVYTVKLRGAPFNVTEKNVREFFLPLKPVAIRIARNKHGNKTGYVFVDFTREEEVQKALKQNNEYMGGRYIEVSREERVPKMKFAQEKEEQPWQRRKKDDEEEEDLSESGRLFVRNLPYSATEEDLDKLFSKYGPLSEIHFPIDSLTKKPKGFAFITYMIPEHAVKAFAEVDGQVFQGRMLHVLPSTLKKEVENTSAAGSSSYKKQKDSKDKASSGSSHNWNTLFMGTNAVADAIAQKYHTAKSQVLDHEGRGSVAVRVALGETQLVQEVRQFLIDNGVSLDSFSQASGERSKTVILAKNLPAGTCVAELEEVFGRYGSLGRVLLPEGGITAIVEFLEPTEAKRAFTKLAYSKFQHVPLYLEWAPMDVFSCPPPEKKQPEIPEEAERARLGAGAEEMKEGLEELAVEEEDEEDESVPGCTLFIKNLSFATTEETLKETFSKVGAVKSCTISKKTDKAGTLLSMGFGFVEYKKPENAQKALKQLQGCMVDGHQLAVKISERAIKSTVTSSRKKQILKKQKSSKILVRNIPFQATVREIRELFSTFGELKTVRLPKKMAGTGSHRGFGFVDFLTKQDAKKAFNALCHSTHLYGRRLVLEWADTEETVEALRRKTAEHFHGFSKKKKQSVILDEILQQIEEEYDDDGDH
ncbi:PREDICTED: probable RNA-binding protein 19 [Crocodylus porosus]|uniref:Probable RNA-binding protein 19 n=1 Tax=Crocodylus porosus TaxID=8502 RepID=A0A7M4EI68_CROPO|nr:PREDICTED: probable RNA-binding protein 19 [Crocodylus porosus]XP_019394889.1 PREDICTED: probable RNA-binding protein 19 [Crocodylus porosus]